MTAAANHRLHKTGCPGRFVSCQLPRMLFAAPHAADDMYHHNGRQIQTLPLLLSCPVKWNRRSLILTVDHAVILHQAITGWVTAVVGGVKCHVITKPGKRESCFLMYTKWNCGDRMEFKPTDDFMFALCFFFTCNWKFSLQEFGGGWSRRYAGWRQKLDTGTI